ncbi:uncharacterized protein stbd1 [Plectropomus leopardus]|uniref:uncharacterized protein stbd1 n=1 Tax=Plectropomus leopardus TaxID=160734 RepID=UPI001C4CBF2A|nr:uncharacterized protein stbd1 [Plectropomus leopardus]
MKNGNTVAVERRMDLASFFCMIGRHGPAVALAVIAMISVLAGFIIYRTVRRKRRKATADDGDSTSPGADRDASVIPPSSEESHSTRESTDVSDEGSSDVTEDFDVIQSDLKMRHRRAAAVAAVAAAAAAESKPPLYTPPKIEIQVPDYKHTTSDETEEMAVVLDSNEVPEMYAKEATQSLQSDTYTEAEMVAEDAVDCQQGETDDVIKDVLEEVHDNDSCWRKPEPISDENHKEKEKVSKAECWEDEDVTTDKDVFVKTAREEEENLQCALNSAVHFEQSPCMSDGDRTQDDKTTNSIESNLEGPVSVIEDVPVPFICYGKDGEFEEESQDSNDYSSHLGNAHLSLGEEKKKEVEEAEGECVDQQAEIGSLASEEEINLPSTQQEQCDCVMDKVAPPIQDRSRVEDSGLTGKEVIDEDHLNEFTAVKFDTQSPQFAKQDVEIEQEENGLACDQENSVLHEDHVKEKFLTSDIIIARCEEHYSSNVAPSSSLPCLSAPVRADNHDDGLPDMTTDFKAQISGIADFPDLSLNHQEPPKEDEIDPSLVEDTDSAVLSPQMQSHQTENLPENNKNGTAIMLAEECNDQVNEPHVQSCFKDQQGMETKRSEALGEAGVTPAPDIVACDGEITTTRRTAEVSDKASTADPDTVENAPSVIVGEMFYPLLSSICQDQKSDCMHNNKTSDKTGLDSAPADDCNNALLNPEEIPCPDMLSLSQDQQSDHVEKNKTFDETKVNSAIDAPTCDNANITSPKMFEEIFHPDASSSQDPQNDQMENNEIFHQAEVDSAIGAPACDDTAISSPIISEESHPDVLSSSKDQQSDHMENNEIFHETKVDSAIDTPVCDNATITSPTISEEICYPDMLSSFQDQQSDCIENNGTFNETTLNSAIEAPACDNATITSPIISEEFYPDMLSFSQNQQSDQSVAPVMTEDNGSPIYQYHLLSLERRDTVDNDLSFAHVAEESGISSMTVSPDAGNEFDVIFENVALPMMDYDLQPEGQTEVQNSLFADDVAVSVIKEDTAGMVFGPYSSLHSQPPHSECTSWTNYESVAANEDVFGHEVEDSYHRAMDQFMAQIVDSVTSYTDELKKQADVKVVVEVEEVKEKKTKAGVEKKEETKAEEKEEDYEKTEISIMEATMDHNEWIMENNYQVLPWMNLSVPSFTEDHTKINQPPTEECQSSSAVTTTTSMHVDTTYIPPSTEVKQTSALSVVDENMDSNKKVVAVQPMPQNVNVTFRVHYLTQSPYQTVAVTGNQEELGNWKSFIPLERAKGGHWSTLVSLPAESHVEWKFVVLDKGQVCRWEECGNRLLDTGFGDDLLVQKMWGYL